jgi:pimeloyl-ACP methyl ester carboxylesterase
LWCGTYATGTLDPEDNPAGPRWLDEFQRVRATLEHWGEGHTLAVFAPSADGERERIGCGIFERSAASPQMARTLIEMVVETDVRDLLPSIRVPTLVLHREEEFIPVEGARDMAQPIPGARLVVLPGTDHIPFYGDADGYAEEIEEFLAGARHAPVSDRVLQP